MSKTLKMGILLVIITLGFLFLGTEVKAVDINPAALVESFEGKDVTINGTTITLNDDVDFLGDVVCFYEGNFVLDLNGHTVTAGEMYIEDGKLTIEDSKGNGKIDVSVLVSGEAGTLIINNGIFSTDRKQEEPIIGENSEIVDHYYIYVNTYIECYGTATINGGTIEGGLNVWETGNCTINNGRMSTITNEGNLTINNATVSSIMNSGTITIEDGSFGGISQDGKGTINGGVFTAHEEYIEDYETAQGEPQGGNVYRMSVINMDTVLNGGEFKKDGVEVALDVYSNEPNVLTINSIEELVGLGFVAEYESTGQAWEWNVSYNYAKVVKDESEEILNKIAPNGVWKINGAKPADWEESDFLLKAIAGDTEVPKGYELFAFCDEEDPFNPENVILGVSYNNTPLKRINVKAVYNEPEKEVKDKVGSILDKVAEKTGESHKVETGFRLEDLYLINYLNVAKDGVNSSLALNFSKDLIALTNGGNITYKFDSRLGSSTPTELWNYTGGRVIVYYDGVGVGTTEIGLTLNNVLYVPSDTAENQKIDAALARIKDYLGTTDGITITKGGTLDSLNADGLTWKDYEFIDENTSGSNYYNVTIKGETYKFAICKKDSDKLETPKYVGTDVISKISVTSEDKTIPLDTAVTVKKVKNDNIEKALGTDAYAAYDITLYSNAKEAKVKELKNGMFKVSIPVPEKLKNIENLTVYYIDDNGNKKDYNGKVDDETGIATFETNHFSTYALAEKEEEKVEIYSLTLDANEGKFSDGKTKLGFEDVTKCDMTKVEKPVKDGYTFKGWFTEKTGGKSIETVMSSEDGIKENMTFYAQWEENSSAGEPGIPEGGEQEDNNNTGNTDSGNTNTGNTNTGNTNTNKPTGNNPQTGDNIVMFTVISLIAFAGIAVAIKVKKYVK